MATSDLGTGPTRAFAQAMAGAATFEQRATPAAAFRRARATFRSGSRLDMGQLAGELGVARATLYRWTGDRNRLLSDIAWTEVQALLAHVDRNTAEVGVGRLQRMAATFLAAMAENASLNAFLTLEGDAGLRLFTAPTGHVRPRIIDAVTELIDREAQAGHYRPPDDPRILADGIVSLGERFLYHAGERAMRPDPETARRIIGLLLREPSAAG
jgi:AcrR family transcriptional regulator